MQEPEQGDAGQQAQTGDAGSNELPASLAMSNDRDPAAPTGSDEQAAQSAPPPATQTAQAETAAAQPVVWGTTRVERARELPELAKGEDAELIGEGIQSFKDTDRRTMNVVLRGNQLFKQQAPERATQEV